MIWALYHHGISHKSAIRRGRWVTRVRYHAWRAAIPRVTWTNGTMAVPRRGVSRARIRRDRLPRTWVIEQNRQTEKGRKGEPDKRSPVTLGADTLRLARHPGRPLRAVRRRLNLPRHRSIGEVLHHANAQPRAARRLLRQPGPRVSSNGAGETGSLPEAIEGVVGVALAIGVPAEQIDL